MKLKGCILILFTLSVFSEIFTQGYEIKITLSNVEIIDECHFGDDWSADFSCGGKYRDGDTFSLEPNQKFGLTSRIFEGEEIHNDHEQTTTVIAYEDLEIGRYKYEELLYVEDKNTGRYECNNATFRFSYIIRVTEK